MEGMPAASWTQFTNHTLKQSYTKHDCIGASHDRSTETQCASECKPGP